MHDERWEPGMPTLDRQPVREPSLPTGLPPGLPPSLRGLPPRSVPELRPTPLQRHYSGLSVVALVCGAVAITALELGVPLGSLLVKMCVLVGAPLLFLSTADAGLRIWRSAWAWMPVNPGRGAFRLAWFAATVILLATLAAAAWAVLSA
jgi:hypothetical protein